MKLNSDFTSAAACLALAVFAFAMSVAWPQTHPKVQWLNESLNRIGDHGRNPVLRNLQYSASFMMFDANSNAFHVGIGFREDGVVVWRKEDDVGRKW